ncbi:hypothetical protein BDV98DRAFT_187894 [Pterulicium gracile]|uniref:Uncharacterized protein n=1 Tax=Pterulicium gracile TaxID=1884261 RepID=A0A5C3QBS2_9AGAR|nr:hypothetical protein BDV98DRAFT_187894 [Pterula gracilis]
MDAAPSLVVLDVAIEIRRSLVRQALRKLCRRKSRKDFFQVNFTARVQRRGRSSKRKRKEERRRAGEKLLFVCWRHATSVTVAVSHPGPCIKPRLSYFRPAPGVVPARVAVSSSCHNELEEVWGGSWLCACSSHQTLMQLQSLFFAVPWSSRDSIHATLRTVRAARDEH